MFSKLKNLFKQNSDNDENYILLDKKNLSKYNNSKNYLVDGTDITKYDCVDWAFPIKGGRVIKVYDGDTITIATKLPYDESPLYKLQVRLNSIDTPELKGSNDDEKQAAKFAQDFVSKMVLNKYVRLENIRSEKYGRVLADVFVGEINLNELLIKERYAVTYNGGHKVKPASWLKYRSTGEL
jgi:endonuclease YncB( thermonuclease family)